MFASIILLFVIAVALCSRFITSATKGKTFDNINDVPPRETALLLGTSPMLAGGYKNLYFVYRINAAAELYKAGVVKRIIISGDNRLRTYNEPEAMQKALVSAGVPEKVIFADYAGFRTLDSVVRAYEIFGQQSFIVVSQKFHNERAIFIAGTKGIDAIGYNARDVAFTPGLKTRVRELFARVKVFIDLAFNKQPHFLGEKIDINSPAE